MAFSERTAAAWRATGSVLDPVSERIVKVRLKLHTGYVSLFAVYAPTNELKNEGQTEEFYQSLQAAVRRVPQSDMVLVLGDLNAPVGNDANTYHGTCRNSAYELL